MKNIKNCVYCFISPSGKSYIGITNNFQNRYNDHKRNITNNIKTKFYDACRKYDFKNFKVEILEENITNRKQLNELEKFYINYFNTFGDDCNGYNMTKGGDGTQLFGELNGMYNRKHTEESILKMKQNRKNKCVGSDNAWHTSNKTPEELSARGKKAAQKFKENFEKLSDSEKEIVRRKRSQSGKKAAETLKSDPEKFQAFKNKIKETFANKSQEVMQEINKRKSLPGIKNGRALVFILSKDKTEYRVELRSGLEKFCKENNLLLNVCLRYVNKGIIPEPTRYDTKFGKDEQYTINRINTTGWSIKQMRIKDEIHN